MIVSGATVAAASYHRFEASYQKHEASRFWTGMQDPAAAPVEAPRLSVPPVANDDYSTGRLAARQRHALRTSDLVSMATPSTCSGDAPAEEGDPKTARILRLLEKMFGVHFKRLDLHLDFSQAQAVQQSAHEAQSAQQQADANQGKVGWGYSYDHVESYQEYEQTSVGMSGTFTTDDGRSFEFSFSYKMERLYQESSETHIRMGDAVVKDPLVLDLGGAGGLANDTFAIDLDQDGKEENVHRLQGGQYFLARDADGDGVISGGGDLFGAKSGDGFGDLAALDEDGNGFLDGGDKAFAQLRLWDGVNAPILLSDFRIAAIGTDGIDAPFTYTDQDNKMLGQNRRLGLYLTDDGQAGAVKQIDLVA